MGEVISLSSRHGEEPGLKEQPLPHTLLLIQSTGILPPSITGRMSTEQLQDAGLALLATYSDYRGNLRDIHPQESPVYLATALMHPGGLAEAQRRYPNEPPERFTEALGRVISGLVELKDNYGLLHTLRIATAQNLEEMQKGRPVIEEPQHVAPSTAVPFQPAPNLKLLPLPNGHASTPIQDRSAESDTRVDDTDLECEVIEKDIFDDPDNFSPQLLEASEVVLARTKHIPVLTREEEVKLALTIQADLRRPATQAGDERQVDKDLNDSKNARLAAEETLLLANQRLINLNPETYPTRSSW